MNSLFDPECHRQVLGNRQKAKGQKRGGRKRGGRRRTGPARWDRQCGANPEGGRSWVQGGQNRGSLHLPGSGPVNSSDCCHVQPHSEGPGGRSWVSVQGGARGSLCPAHLGRAKRQGALPGRPRILPSCRGPGALPLVKGPKDGFAPHKT